MRGWPSVTKTSPVRSGKTQLSTLLARAARYVNRIHLSKGLEGAGFSGPGQSGRAEGGPGAMPGRGVRRAPPSAPGASAGGGPKPTSGPPPRRPAPPPRPAPAPPASARRREQERGPGTPRGWRPRLASPPPPGPPRWPRPPGAVLPPGAGPSPGAGPRQARPARRAPCVPVAGPRGEGTGGGTPARTGASRPLPCNRGRRLQEAKGWSRVRELSGLASPPAA